MVIDEGLLDEKLAVVEKAREWSPRVVAKLDQLLHAPDDWALVRMNPFAFARENRVAPNEALDLFLHAARAGVLTMDWHLLCPNCGIAVESFASLRALHSHLFCALCVIQVEANLDDFIQVSFTAAPAVRRLPVHDPESLSAADFLYRVCCTRELHFQTLDGPRMSDLLKTVMLGLEWVRPGETRELQVELVSGLYSAVELQAHSGKVGQIRPDAPADHLTFVVEESALGVTHEDVRPGRVTVNITNRRATPVVFAIDSRPQDLLDGGMPHTVWEPFVTGAMLLANQTFRRLYRSETIHGLDGVGVRDVTVLFTDLKSSTALYERIGDLQAFTLVQRHFEHLGAVVQANGGAIVKTIGDAVMAAFTRPLDAVRAALEMRARIEEFNRERGSRDVVLKIGIHRGPSIAVTLNESLDYFGHTVNVAARVQGLADADQIYVTDDILRGEGVTGVVSPVDSRDAQLRGIQREVRVHQVIGLAAPYPG